MPAETHMIEQQVRDSLCQYYRCPSKNLNFALKGPLGANIGYFHFGEGAVCYGSCAGQVNSEYLSREVPDALLNVELREGTVYLPFNPSQVVENLRRETYVSNWRRGFPVSALSGLYYSLRPLLPIHVRKHIQRFYFRNWYKSKFPRWPVDCSVDNIHAQLLYLSLKATHKESIPFIWFWPDGAAACAIMTHDVETKLGTRFCRTLMDIDDSFGIKSSFQIIPEERYCVTPEFLSCIRDRGFEIVVHDLNHDGHLYKNRAQFLDRAAKINSYAAAYGAEGFRAGSLYRKQLWYDALKVSYDMSVPNVGHLDPQHGGCCTVMPYFIDDILEVPVTTTQDYTLFHLLHQYSIDLWKEQMDIITQKHGLISFIVHPDYIGNPKQRRIYEILLGYLSYLQAEKSAWVTSPAEVNRWWRQRAEMRLEENCKGWQIVGPGKERARIAWAREEEGRLVFALEPQVSPTVIRKSIPQLLADRHSM
jgi:hypothetical protein